MRNRALGRGIQQHCYKPSAVEPQHCYGFSATFLFCATFGKDSASTALGLLFIYIYIYVLYIYIYCVPFYLTFFLTFSLAFSVACFLAYFDILSGILSGIWSDILSGIFSGILFKHSFWHLSLSSIWYMFWHSIWHFFCRSIWHVFRHCVWHSIWYSVRPSIWHYLWHAFDSRCDMMGGACSRIWSTWLPWTVAWYCSGVTQTFAASPQWVKYRKMDATIKAYHSINQILQSNGLALPRAMRKRHSHALHCHQAERDPECWGFFLVMGH